MDRPEIKPITLSIVMLNTHAFIAVTIWALLFIDPYFGVAITVVLNDTSTYIPKITVRGELGRALGDFIRVKHKHFLGAFQRV